MFNRIDPTIAMTRGRGRGGAVPGAILGTAFRGGANFATGGGAGAVLGGLGGAGGLAGGSDLDRFEQLISQQMQVQGEMQAFSSESNISKTRHDTAMTAIRNMRA